MRGRLGGDFRRAGPAGRWSFTFAAEVGTTYYLSLCPGTGGSADFDTTLSISQFGSELAFNDDACGLQSEIVWIAPYSSTFTVTVGSFQDSYQGTFQLGYRRDLNDVLFQDGFEG